jgi:hypothetical protein
MLEVEMSVKAMEEALTAFEKIYDGCGFVIQDDINKEVTNLAKLIKRDCFGPINMLRKAIKENDINHSEECRKYREFYERNQAPDLEEKK